MCASLSFQPPNAWTLDFLTTEWISTSRSKQDQIIQKAWRWPDWWDVLSLYDSARSDINTRYGSKEDTIKSITSCPNVSSRLLSRGWYAFRHGLHPTTCLIGHESYVKYLLRMQDQEEHSFAFETESGIFTLRTVRLFMTDPRNRLLGNVVQSSRISQ